MCEQWQPIETAPKDGTRIILFFPKVGDYGHARTEFGSWNEDKYAKKPKPFWDGDLSRIFGITTYRQSPPTHWAPKPPDPVAAAITEQKEGGGNG